MGTTQTKKKYTKSFKCKAVELSNQRGEIKSVAKELDTSEKNLIRWRSEYKDGKLKEDYTPLGKSPEALEIQRLKKELKNQQIECEILKKAVSIFCVTNKANTNL
jgi:transposase